METKKFTQFGTFSVIVLLPLFIFSVVMIIVCGFDDLILFTVLSFISLTLLVCLLIFYKISITIDNSCLSFSLGIGFINKTFRITDIKSCKAVRNPAYYGIGIRLLPDGWLYNVSGLYAIELTLKNKKSKIRIGTNNPYEIAEIVSKLVGNEKSDGTKDDTAQSGFYIFWAILFIVLALPAALIISGTREPKVIFTDSDFSIKGIYGVTINYSDIIQLDTISGMPKIRLRTNGYAFAKTFKGNFRLIDQEQAKLFIKRGFPPFIFIKTDKIRLYINFKNREKTLDLYDDIKTRLGK